MGGFAKSWEGDGVTWEGDGVTGGGDGVTGGGDGVTGVGDGVTVFFDRIAALRFPTGCLWQAVCLRLSPLRFGSLRSAYRISGLTGFEGSVGFAGEVVKVGGIMRGGDGDFFGDFWGWGKRGQDFGGFDKERGESGEVYDSGFDWDRFFGGVECGVLVWGAAFDGGDGGGSGGVGG